MKKVLSIITVFMFLATSFAFAADPRWDPMTATQRSLKVTHYANSSHTLTGQMMTPGALFDNNEADGNTTYVLPDCNATWEGIGGTFISQSGTHKVFLDPQSDQLINPTGTTGQIYVSDAVLGSYVEVRCMKIGTAYNWMVVGKTGTWAFRAR